MKKSILISLVFVIATLMTLPTQGECQVAKDTMFIPCTFTAITHSGGKFVEEKEVLLIVEPTEQAINTLLDAHLTLWGAEWGFPHNKLWLEYNVDKINNISNPNFKLYNYHD